MVQRLLRALKYGDQPEIGEVLGLRYGNDLVSAGFKNYFDIIVPVPIHKKRLQDRGYNQSEYFARGLSKTIGAKVNTEGFIKCKHIDSLTSQSKVDRIVNVDQVFKVVEKEAFRGKRVLLVDDVLTTGSTLMVCTEELLKSQPLSVSVATIAGLK
ncbi:ComF family protein [Roseivirga sp.]|uniref:ComF family protein n=1 Tax=Roseivirga sp. TaxID=1964215 RepID=UPI003B8CB9A1